MKKNVIIINGYGACGKDTFVDMFINTILTYESGINISTVDAVKELSKMMGWDGSTKTEKDRKLWSDIKAAWTMYNDGILKMIMDQISQSNCDYSFVHCREPKEIQKFVDCYKNSSTIICSTLLITKDDVKPPDNISDKSVMDYNNYDFHITNNGSLDHLLMKASKFWSELQ